MEVLRLRRFDPEEDYPFFYRVYSDYEEQHNLFDFVNLNSPERFPKKFEHALSHNYNDTMIVEDCKSGEYVGFLVSYGYAFNDGHIRVMAYIEKKYRSCGYGGLAMLRFLHVLFQFYNIRKIYTEVYEFNDDSLKAHLGAGFEEEARLKEYRYYDGRFWDFITFSIDRAHFYEKNRGFLARLEKMVSVGSLG